MTLQNISHQNLSRVIAHVDADAFFASCEQALNPALRGKPVIVGGERGIVTALSYEAKALGITRGMPVYQLRQNYPEVICLSGNYEAYSLFSRRMFSILKTYTHEVEEVGSDEGFMNLTGIAQSRGVVIEQLITQIQQDISQKLGIGVSIGVASTKCLAKLGSGARKPLGRVVIYDDQVDGFLQSVSVSDLWGVGRSTTHYMNQMGIYTAQAFYRKSFDFVKAHFTKPHRQIWQELHGHVVYPLCLKHKDSYASISKTHTFGNMQGQRNLIYSELLHNLEGACHKARKYGMVASRLKIFLKRKDFSYKVEEIKLPESSAYPLDLTQYVAKAFEKLYSDKEIFRSSGITLSDLHFAQNMQMSLLCPPEVRQRMQQVYEAVDGIGRRFGKYTVQTGEQNIVPRKKHLAFPQFARVS
ncbi:DNA polymerase IV [Candidatus Nomurabacteria bacterium]|nr:DNA polymerase IV [Candidatus Nomurabacteria bacterium]